MVYLLTLLDKEEVHAGPLACAIVRSACAIVPSPCNVVHIPCDVVRFDIYTQSTRRHTYLTRSRVSGLFLTIDARFKAAQAPTHLTSPT